MPRLVNLLYAKVKAQVDAAEGEKGDLMRKVLAEKLVNIKKDGRYLHEQDSVFAELRAQAGGKLRMLMSGAAPTSQEV